MTGSTASAPPAPTAGEGKGLAAGTLGLWGSTVIGLASTAPVYSLAATLGFVVLAVGAQAPIAFVIAFVPMLLIAFAYRELNRDVPDCGTTFTWATKAFGPWVGWLGGWGVAVAGTVVLANLAQIGGIYFWLLVAPDLAENVPVVTATGVVFIALMSFISWRGLEIGERMQNVLLGVQYLALVLFVVFAAGAVITGTAPEGSTTPSARLVQPLRVRVVRRVHRVGAARAVHLLGLGHLPRAERGDPRPEAHPGTGRRADDAHPARDLRGRRGRGDVVRRARRHRHRPRQRGERRRRVLRAEGRALRSVGVAARGRGHDLGGVVDADDDPADGARHPRDGGLQGAAQAVRHGASEVPHAVVLDDPDGGRRDRVLRRA